MRQDQQDSHSAITLVPTRSVVLGGAGSQSVLACMVADAVAMARSRERLMGDPTELFQNSGGENCRDLKDDDGGDSGLAFDADTYAMAVPLLHDIVNAMAVLGCTGNDLKESMRAVIRMLLDNFGAQTAGNMKPYVVRFFKDLAIENDAGQATPIWTESQAQEMAPVVCKSIVEAMERGFVRFPEAALYVRDYIVKDMSLAKANAIPFTLIQGAYISLHGRFKHLGTTPKVEVVSFESFADLQQKCGGVR